MLSGVQFCLTLLTWMFHLHRPLLYSHLCKCFMSILHLYPILFVLHITSSLFSDLFLNNGHNMQYFLTFFLFKWVFFVQNIFYFYASLIHNFGQSGVRALPLGVAAKRSVHYIWYYFYLFSFCATYFSPRRVYRRVPKFCIGF